MTEDRVTDGRRIAQLLASELSGLERGSLEAVSVADADPDAMPSERGTDAYRISHRGDRVATVVLYPDCAAVRLRDGLTGPREVASTAGDLSTDETASLRVSSGAAVKRAVDAIADLLGE